MIGLIKKDLLLVKANLKMLFLVFIFLCLFLSRNQIDLTFFLPLICIMLFVSTFSYDDFNHWNAYAISLPISRATIVKSKYIATFLLAIITSAIGISLSYLVMLFMKQSIVVNELFSNLLISLLAISIVAGIMYPLIFKYGAEKGRIFLFLVVIVIASIASIFSHLIDPTFIAVATNFFENFFYLLLPLLMVIIFGISYFISLVIYKKKEF